MTVYVDEIEYYPTQSIKPAARRYGNHWCHLTADNIAELHEFAARIGLKRSWFQDHAIAPHYDLTRRRRQAALDAGAVFKPALDQMRQRLREDHRRIKKALEEKSK